MYLILCTYEFILISSGTCCWIWKLQDAPPCKEHVILMIGG